MKDRKTTIIGILTAVGTILAVVVRYLSTGSIDFPTALTGVTGLLAALGFHLAADSK